MKTKSEPVSITPEQPEPSPAPPAELDLLRAKVTGLSPKEEQAMRERLLTRITESTVAMSVISLQEVAQAVDVCVNDQGCVTPFEDFVASLLMLHYHHGVTPDEAVELLDSPDGFRANFVDFVKTAQRFRATYPRIEAVRA